MAFSCFSLSLPSFLFASLVVVMVVLVAALIVSVCVCVCVTMMVTVLCLHTSDCLCPFVIASVVSFVI